MSDINQMNMNGNMMGQMNPMMMSQMNNNMMGQMNPMMMGQMNSNDMMQMFMNQINNNNQMQNLSDGAQNFQNQQQQNNENYNNTQATNPQNQDNGNQLALTFIKNNDTANQRKITVYCLSTDKVGDVVQKYRIKADDHNQNEKFIFNAKKLNLDLTVSEAGLLNESKIFVMVTEGIVGGKKSV